MERLMLGIFGGTFDPIHDGHLRPLIQAALGLQPIEIVLMPAGQPPHRELPMASPEDRLRMTEIAADAVATTSPLSIRVDDREMHRSTPSWTVITLEEFRADDPGRPIALFVGEDAFLGLESWHRWARIPELAHLVVLARPGSSGERWPEWTKARVVTDPLRLASQPAGLIFRPTIAPVDISATRIRSRIAEGRPITEFVPAGVARYIEAHRLYRTP